MLSASPWLLLLLSGCIAAQTTDIHNHTLLPWDSLFSVSSSSSAASESAVAASAVSDRSVMQIRTHELLTQRQQIVQQLMDMVPDHVPPDVQCDKIKRCDKRKICGMVCKSGSVQLDTSFVKIVQLQNQLAYRRSFCEAQLIGSHNSAIDLTDGYGIEDHVFEGYLQYITWYRHGMHVHTNDQLFSLTDQLRMGARLLELDVHWFDGDLRIAHCGGFGSKLLDDMIDAFNHIANLLGMDIQWDSETIGCKPSLSSIPASEQRKLSEALQEIAAWMNAPENKNEFLLLFFDDETDLSRWKKVRTLLSYLKQHFPMDQVVLPSDMVRRETWPTFEELLQSGKRVMFLSGSNYSPTGDELLFIKNTICNWTEPDLPLEGFPKCRFRKPSTYGPSTLGISTIFRPETSEIEYGFLNAGGHFGKNENLLDESSLPAVAECGVNFPSPDNITPKRIIKTFWSFQPDTKFPIAQDECVVVTRTRPQWQVVKCDDRQNQFVAVCFNATESTDAFSRWALGAEPIKEDQAEKQCKQQNLIYSIPASGFENRVIYELLQHHAPPSIQGVWLNGKDLLQRLGMQQVQEEPQVSTDGETHSEDPEEELIKPMMQQIDDVVALA